MGVEFKDKGISEVVSSMLMLLIVVAIGVFVVVNLAYTYSLNQQVTSQKIVEEEVASRQDLTILLVSGRVDGTVYVVVASGNWPVEVHAVYVNNTLVREYNPPLEIGSLEVVELTLTTQYSLRRGGVIVVRIAYGGGIVEGYGEVA